MGLRDILRKLGLGSPSGDVQPGVRRARLPQRAADAPTVRVPMGPGGADPGAAPPPAAPSPAVTPPSSPAAPTARPAAPPSVRPAAPAPPPPSGSELGGATQYFQVPLAASRDLVGVLVGIDGPLKGQVYTVNDGDTRLGREGCEVTLPSKRISRYHAKIVHAEGAFVIEANPEVATRNPTVINDDPIDAEALCDGDVIRLGDCTFKFRTL